MKVLYYHMKFFYTFHIQIVHDYTGATSDYVIVSSRWRTDYTYGYYKVNYFKQIYYLLPTFLLLL